MSPKAIQSLSGQQRGVLKLSQEAPWKGYIPATIHGDARKHLLLGIDLVVTIIIL
jgi:hypothetical protein